MSLSFAQQNSALLFCLFHSFGDIFYCSNNIISQLGHRTHPKSAWTVSPAPIWKAVLLENCTEIRVGVLNAKVLTPSVVFTITGATKCHKTMLYNAQ